MQTRPGRRLRPGQRSPRLDIGDSCGGDLPLDAIQDAANRLFDLGISLQDLGDYSRDEFLAKCAEEPLDLNSGVASMAKPGALRRALTAAVDLAGAIWWPPPHAHAPPGAQRDPQGPETRTPSPGPSRARSQGRAQGLDLNTPSPPRAFTQPQTGAPEGLVGEDRLCLAVGQLLQQTQSLTRRQAPFGEEEDNSEKFDLAGFKRKRVHSDCSLLDINSFCDPAHLARLSRQCEMARAHRPGAPWLHPSGFESLQPAWVGSGLPSPERREFAAQRSKVAPTSSAALVSSITAYWLSHAAMGQVSVMAVFAHVILVCKLCDQHSLGFTLRYLSNLSAMIHSKINSGEPISLDRAITEVNIDVLRISQFEYEKTLGARQDQEKRKVLALAGSGVVKGKGKGKGKDKPPPSPEALGTEAPPKRDRGHICFEHDPANSKTCPRGRRCSNEHLDTTQEQARARFSKAKAVFDRHKAKTSKAAH